jgi:hypothetical protein
MNRIGVLLLAWGLFASEVRAQSEGRYLPPNHNSTWQLGVVSQNLRGGVRITRVLPISPAKQSGLEVGDIILSVNRVPVGLLGAQLNDLEDELNRQADGLGRVVLRVRNGRDGGVVTVPVRLTPANNNGWGNNRPPWWDWGNGGGNGGIVVDPTRQAINDLYITYLGRQADANGMNNWLQQIARGMTLGEVHANILASAEFFDRCSNDPDEWVTQLYEKTAGRRGTRPEVRIWLQTYETFRGERLQVAREFLKALNKY